MSRKRVVALRYRAEQDRAPRVVAKGSGAVAQALLDVATRNDVKILENESLVDSLMHLEVHDVIPEELYGAVAEILAYVYKSSNESS